VDWSKFKQFGRQRIFRLLALILIPIIAIAIIPMGLRVNAQGANQKPNILVIWGDDIGQSNISAVVTQPFNRSKIVFVGRGRAGKTSTVGALLGRPFSAAQPGARRVSRT
jgi:hypothetical protein